MLAPKKALLFLLLGLTGILPVQQDDGKGGKPNQKRKGFWLDEFNKDIAFVFKVDSTFYDYLVLNKVPDFKWAMMDTLYDQGMTTDDSTIRAEMGPRYDPRYEVIFYYAVVPPVSDTSALIDSLLRESSR